MINYETELAISMAEIDEGLTKVHAKFDPDIVRTMVDAAINMGKVLARTSVSTPFYDADIARFEDPVLRLQAWLQQPELNSRVEALDLRGVERALTQIQGIGWGW